MQLTVKCSKQAASAEYQVVDFDQRASAGQSKHLVAEFDVACINVHLLLVEAKGVAYAARNRVMLHFIIVS